ncbi:hypothetical protein CDD83_2952 [Cordyceps sp. RAO-2017]|nr:hypothetical protein CDD83_2952 [Cordyceps sp. RAO-2017]
MCEPPVGPDLAVGTARSFASSDGVLRAFCAVCGATVFFSCAANRPSDGQAVVDVATGILRAPDGAMAEDWLTWNARLLFADGGGMAFDPDFCQSLASGMRAWVKERYGQELEFDLS